MANPMARNSASEIERIARARVGAGGGEFSIFAQVPGGYGANEEAEAGDGSAHGYPMTRGRGEQQVENGDRIAGADAPAHPEFSWLNCDGFVQTRIPFKRAMASITCSTVIESMAEE